MKRILAGLTIFPLLAQGAGAAQFCGWPWIGCSPAGCWGWGMGGFMSLFWIIVLVLIVVAVLSHGRRQGGGAAGQAGGRAMEILKERYAKGEITKEQFEQMKKDIFG